MSIITSRRKLLWGAAGTALALNAGMPALAKPETKTPGAFPDLPFTGELLGPQKGVAKLISNENPYGPAPSALKMAEYAAKKGAYYPSGAARTLSEMIAERHGLSRENITLTTGSAEALSALALIYGQKGPIVAPRLFFDATALYAEKLGLATIERAPIAADMSIDIAAIESRVTAATGLVQLCNPNNPTGMISDPATLKAAVKRMAKLAPVIVDEAYIELVRDTQEHSCVDLVKQGHNVIVSRTFSKIYGMAGLRVGYTISTPEMAQEIRAAAMSWMSSVGLAAAIGCYNDTKFIDYSKSKIFEARDMIETKLGELGLKSLPSQTNFVYFKSGKDANAVKDAFDAKNIQIRGQYMDYAEWTRVSVGKIKDVRRFCDTLPEVIGA